MSVLFDRHYDAILDAVCISPHDAHPRRAMADWLEEQGGQGRQAEQLAWRARRIRASLEEGARRDTMSYPASVLIDRLFSGDERSCGALATLGDLVVEVSCGFVTSVTLPWPYTRPHLEPAIFKSLPITLIRLDQTTFPVEAYLALVFRIFGAHSDYPDSVAYRAVAPLIRQFKTHGFETQQETDTAGSRFVVECGRALSGLPSYFHPPWNCTQGGFLPPAPGPLR